MSAGLWVFLGVAAVVFVVVPVHFYNRLVTLRNRCRESWANVETELKRRYDLIPNLVRTVQAYARHEKDVIEQVVRLRTQAMDNHGPATVQERDEKAFVHALGRLFAVAEGYPELKASASFLALQRELAITEDRIQAARRFYNANVRDYRDTRRTFPGNLFADTFGFEAESFFQIDPVETVVPPVDAAAGVRA